MGTEGLDRCPEWEEGQDWWRYGMNQTDRKDKQVIGDYFFSFIFSDNITYHTHYFSLLYY
jgi:hypothetical protein